MKFDLQNKDNRVLLLILITRIIHTAYLLFFTKMEFIYILIILFIIDLIDCEIPRLLKLYNNKNICDSNEYKFIDTISSIITYLLITYYIFGNNIKIITRIPKIYLLIFVGFFALRIHKLIDIIKTE